jgi:cobalamin biosynthesis Co2+ chelatase CbiK
MKKPADLDILLGSLAKHRRQKHQVIILYPDEITILKDLVNGFSEKFVDLLIGLPPLFIERDFTRVVMEQGPKNTTKNKIIILVMNDTNPRPSPKRLYLPVGKAIVVVFS